MGANVGGFGNNYVLEKVQLKFLKSILGLKASTASCIVYGETGVTPLSIDIETRIISYWSKLIVPRYPKLTSSIYKIMLSNYNHEIVQINKYPWIKNVKDIFVKCGLINIWEFHVFPNENWLIQNIKHKLTDLFLNEWYSSVDNSSKCSDYKLFKQSFGFEKYLINTPKKYLRHVIRFRTRNHRLPVETGSWNGVDLALRKCNLCNANSSIGDEYHYLLECTSFKESRKRYVDKKYYCNPNIIKFNSLMNLDISNLPKYRKFCLFVKQIVEVV